MGGVPAALTRSSNPQRCSCKMPARVNAWVDSVSVSEHVCSTTATCMPARASNMAVAAPASRAPTTTTSKISESVESFCTSNSFRSVRSIPFHQMLSDSQRVGADPVEEVGPPSSLKALAEHVQARNWSDSVGMHKLAVGTRDGYVQPVVIAAVAGCPDDGRDTGGSQIEAAG